MRVGLVMALLAAGLAAGLWVDDVGACSCPRLEPCAAEAELVFIGVVSSSRDVDGVQLDTWAVDEVIQGDAPDELELRRADAFGCNPYGTELTAVVVREDEAGPFTHACFASQNAEDLERARSCEGDGGCSVVPHTPGSSWGLAFLVVLLGYARVQRFSSGDGMRNAALCALLPVDREAVDEQACRKDRRPGP